MDKMEKSQPEPPSVAHLLDIIKCQSDTIESYKNINALVTKLDTILNLLQKK